MAFAPRAGTDRLRPTAKCLPQQRSLRENDGRFQALAEREELTIYEKSWLKSAVSYFSQLPLSL